MTALKNITISTDTIQMYSRNSRNIELPYTGIDAEAAWIYFNIQPTSTKIVLCVQDDGKVTRYPVSAEAAEIIEILDQFFSQHTATGLSSYWEGIWQAHYIDWRRYNSQPLRIIETISQFPEADRTKILKQLQAIINS